LAKKPSRTEIVEMLPPPASIYATMLALNADLAEADVARKNIASIDAYFKSK